MTAEWIIKNIFSRPCAHCGETDWRKLGCNRLDNSKPHTMDNCEPCCLKCNNRLAAAGKKESGLPSSSLISSSRCHERQNYFPVYKNDKADGFVSPDPQIVFYTFPERISTPPRPLRALMYDIEKTVTPRMKSMAERPLLTLAADECIIF